MDSRDDVMEENVRDVLVNVRNEDGPFPDGLTDECQMEEVGEVVLEDEYHEEGVV